MTTSSDASVTSMTTGVGEIVRNHNHQLIDMDALPLESV